MKTLLPLLSTYRRPIGLALLLQVSLFLFYLYCGNALAATGVFEELDLLFELDPPRAITDFAEFAGDHYRTTVHPIYVLLANPGGSLLYWATGSYVEAALIANAFWGSLGVALAFVFFYLYSGRLLNSFLLAFLFGLSMSQLILSAIPDTASLAICSLLFTYILFLRGLQQQEIAFPWWVLGGILTLGVTTTNFAQTLICLALLTFVLSYQKSSLLQMTLKMIRYGVWVVGITIVLALVQKIIYPSSGLFFLPSAYIAEKDFSTFLILDAPILVVLQELKHFFIVNFVAPFPDAHVIPGQADPAVTFSSSWDYSRVGWLALSLWLGLLAGGLASCWRSKVMRPFFLGVVICLLFNAALHGVYGGGEKGGVVEYFLYTGNFTFLALTFLSPYTQTKSIYSILLISALIVLMGISNYGVFQSILSVYQ